MNYSEVWDAIIYVFGIIGISATIIAIVLGITRAIVKIVSWKRGVDSEERLIWEAIDAINKRLKDAQR